MHGNSRLHELLETGEVQDASAKSGERLLSALQEASLSRVTALRGRGLWVGLDIAPAAGTAHQVCMELLAEGLLCKDAHEQIIRLAPPLTITADELEWAIERLVRVLR
jgi:ornithine--oxo-acid transaminase